MISTTFSYVFAQDHLHDVHAFVRSKVLQLWLGVVSGGALPLTRQHSLLELVIGRLQDKSSQVRKYAIQLTTALLRNNPFAAKVIQKVSLLTKYSINYFTGYIRLKCTFKPPR